MIDRIQEEVKLSTLELVSTWSCGQPGPVLSIETSCGAPFLDWEKYGAPESYVQALVVDRGRYPTTPTVVLSTVATLT